MWSIWKLSMSRNNFKKLKIRPFKLQISPMGNIACRQTCNHSKTLSYCYVSGQKNVLAAVKYSWSHSSEVRDSPSYVTISCCLRSRFESCNGVIVPNLLVFQLEKSKEMFICIAKELSQLYKLYDIDMIYWQLLVNLTKPMRFMSEVESWIQSVSGIFSMYFAIFCYFPHLLTAFSNFECTRSNFLAEETAALHWNVGVFPATSR